MRTIALLAAGSAAIHQARYSLGYGSDAGRELAAHSHGYLTASLPLVVGALVLVMTALMLRIARGGQSSAIAERPLWALWLAAAGALALIFTIQETLEGAPIIAAGGWIGPLLALPAGLVVALALRGATVAESAAPSRPIAAIAVLLDALASSRAPESTGRIAAFRRSARAPPLPSVV